MGFPRQKHWSGLPFPFPGNLPNPGIEPMSPAFVGGFFTTEPQGKSFENVCPAFKWIGGGLWAFLVSASQLPSAQHNPYAKVVYFEVAYSATTHLPIIFSFRNVRFYSSVSYSFCVPWRLAERLAQNSESIFVSGEWMVIKVQLEKAEDKQGTRRVYCKT